MIHKAYIFLSMAFIIAIIPFRIHAVEGDEINKQGVELGEKKQYDKAIKKFDTVINQYDKNSAKLYHNKAWTLQQKGDIDDAKKNYEEALRRYPAQTLSGENLGLIYYNSKEYDNAIRIGEQVLKYDPENKEVKKWLPDAYKKRIGKGDQKDLTKGKDDKTEDKNKDKRIIYATIDFMLRTGYYFDDKEYKFVTDEGLISNTPETVYVSFTPLDAWEFNLTMENPFLGALTPTGIIIQSEILETVLKIDTFMLGLGINFSQYNSDVAFDRNKILWDMKVGLIFGYIEDDVEMRITFYPRLLPYDGPDQSGMSLDISSLRIDYMYHLSSRMTIYSLMNFRDFFIFNHTLEQSSYWGVYDIGLGATIGKILPNNNQRDFTFSMEFLLRFYLRDLNNTDPYTRQPNGQGYFGLNTKKWLKGDAFSGYRALSYVFGFRVDEEIFSYLFLYQKFILELGDLREDHHEFNFQLGVGVTL